MESLTPPEPVSVNVGGGNPRLQRESGLELLRLIAMLLIVMHHVYLFGGITVATTLGQILYLFCGSGGKIGVSVFILISAYFMVNKPFKLTRILNIVLQTTFYAVVIYLLFTIFGNVKFTWKGLVFALLPVLYDQYGFVTGYIVMLLLSPVLNLVLHTVNKKTLGRSILGMIGFTILFPYCSFLLIGEIYDVPYLNEVIYFVELYCVGGYLKLYGINLSKAWGVVIITGVTLILGMVVNCFDGWRELCLQCATLSNFVCAVGLLLICKDWKFQSRIVNVLASTTFGIYLIHENSYMRDWEYAFCRQTLFPHVTSAAAVFILMTVTIFVVALVIDLVRQQTIHRITNKCLQAVDRKFAKRKQQKVETPQSTDISKD